MLVNGSRAEHISLADRGLAYGDGLFETIRFRDGRLLFEDLHLERLARGCARLGLSLDRVALDTEIETALREVIPAEGIVKLIITRGGGGRGYRSDAAQPGTRIISLHPLPRYPSDPAAGVKAFLCRQRLGIQPALAGIKHLNRLEQVLASREWPDDSCAEGLMMDIHDNIVEGTRSNLFFAREGCLYTPDLSQCGIDGIMRRVLLDHFGQDTRTGHYPLADLLRADEVFICNSVIGVWPLRELAAGEQRHEWSTGPFAREALELFNRVLRS